MIKVSIIILSWNTQNLLRDCLKSLQDLPSAGYEIIVIDNASTDGSAGMVVREFPEVRLTRNKKNLGFAAGNNQGINLSNGKLVLFLNSDTLVQERSVEKLTQFIEENNEVGAVAPLLFNEDGSLQKDPCYLRFPSPLTVFLYYHKPLRNLTFKLFPSLLLSSTKFDKPVKVDQLPGAALMIRRNILKKIGGFDEKFPLYFEDTDLSFRVKKLGYKLVVVPETKVIHLGRRSIQPIVEKEGLERFYFLNFRSLFWFCEKNYPAWKTLLIKMVVFSHLLRGLKLSLMRKLF